MKYPIIFTMLFILLAAECFAETHYYVQCSATCYGADLSEGNCTGTFDFSFSIPEPRCYLDVGLPAGVYRMSGVDFWDITEASSDSIMYHTGALSCDASLIHIFRTLEGHYAKVRWRIVDDSCSVIEWVYQDDGTTNLNHVLSTSEVSWGNIKMLHRE